MIQEYITVENGRTERHFTSTRGPRVAPLSPEERERVLWLQVWLNCVKRCQKCGQMLPMDLFDSDPVRCGPCVSESKAQGGYFRARRRAS